MRKRPFALALGLVGPAMVSFGSVAATPAKHVRAGAVCTSKIVWRTQRNGTQICPRFHSRLAGKNWVDLRWTGWGSRVARAHGYTYDYPPPAGSVAEFSPLDVRISDPRNCADGVRIYSRVSGTVHYRGSPPRGSHRISRFHYRIYCGGKTTSGGGG